MRAHVSSKAASWPLSALPLIAALIVGPRLARAAPVGGDGSHEDAVDTAAADGDASAAAPEQDDAEATATGADSDVRVGAAEPAEDPVAQAKHWWLRGQELADSGDYFKAAEAWAKSYDHHPTEDALINAARAYQLSDHPLAALRTFLRYQEAFGDEGRFAREANAAVPRLKARIGTIASQQIPEHRAPVEIIINGEPRPLDGFPIFVEPGRIAVVLVARDGRRIPLDIQYLEAGSTLVLDFAIPEAVDPSPETRPSVAPINYGRNRAIRAGFYTTLTMTFVSGAGIAVFGGLTRSATDDYYANNCAGECPDGTDGTDQAERQREAARLQPIYRTTTNIFIGVTAVLGVTTAILGAVSFSGDRKPLRPHVETRAGLIRLVF